MGDTGAAQLHISNVVFSVQVQHAGQVQLHPVAAFAYAQTRYLACVGFDDHALCGNAALIGKAADTAAAVAAHFAPGAIGVVKMQLEIRGLAVVNSHQTVCSV